MMSPGRAGKFRQLAMLGFARSIMIGITDALI